MSAGESDGKRAVLKASSTVVRKEFAKVDVLVDLLANEEMDSYLAGYRVSLLDNPPFDEKAEW